MPDWIDSQSLAAPYFGSAKTALIRSEAECTDHIGFDDLVSNY
jgi:hypothetical protein